MSEDIYELYWEGPFTKEEVKSDKDNVNWKLYAICSPHPIYGANALVYIGKAKNGALERIESHSSSWFDGRNIGGELYVASVKVFDGWDKSNDWKEYNNCLTDKEDEQIKNIEALLIFSLQPAYNTTNKNSADRAKGVRVFNTGKVGSLPFEISAKYHLE